MLEVERPKLTRAQRHWLRFAKNDREGRIRWGVRSNAGGSMRRMCERLKEMGLVEGPPYKITGLGEDALATLDS